MLEHEYYNLHASGARAGHRAQEKAQQFALELMVVHLRLDHNMKMVDIHHRLSVPMKDIKNILATVKD